MKQKTKRRPKTRPLPEQEPSSESNPMEDSIKSARMAYGSKSGPESNPSKATKDRQGTANSSPEDSEDSNDIESQQIDGNKRIRKAPYWHSFAEYLLEGYNQADAYALARPAVVASWKRNSVVSEAYKLSNDRRVVEHLEKAKRQREMARKRREAKLMDNLERREVCRDVAYDAYSNGQTRLKAVKTDAQLAGEWLERVESHQTVNLQALLAELPQDGLPVPTTRIALESSVPAAIETASHDMLPSSESSPSPDMIAWETE